MPSQVIYVPTKGPRRALWREAEAAAHADGKSLSVFVSEAVEEHVRRWRRRESARQRANAAQVTAEDPA
jgi:hypothetical protein